MTMMSENEVRALYRHYKVRLRDYLKRNLITSALEARMWIRILGKVLGETQDDIRRGEREEKEGEVRSLIKRVLKKPIEAYRTMPPHVIAAKKLRALGVRVEPGMVIEFDIHPIRASKVR